MAKLALIEREKKRARLTEKYAPKRTALKAIIADESKSDEERYASVSNCNNCPATPTRPASVTAARSRAVRVARSVNSVSRVTRFVKSLSAAKFLA